MLLDSAGGSARSPAGTTSPGTPSSACARAAGSSASRRAPVCAARAGRGPAPSRTRPAPSPRWRRSRRCAGPLAWRRCRISRAEVRRPAAAPTRTPSFPRPRRSSTVCSATTPCATSSVCPTACATTSASPTSTSSCPAGCCATTSPPAKPCSSSTASPRTMPRRLPWRRAWAAALEAARRPSPAALHGNDLPVFRSNFTWAEYGGRTPNQGVRLRRRHLPGQPQPAARPLLRPSEPAPVRHAADGQSQPVRRLPPLRRLRAHQLLA